MRLRTVALAVMVACASSPNVSANPLTYSTPGVVGTFDGKAANNEPSTVLGIAQQILDLVGLGVVSPANPCPVNTQCYRTSTVHDYSGTLYDGLKIDGGVLLVPTGFEYVLGKYDGQNAGYVLFHLPTFGSNTLPLSPANFWTTGSPEYGLSNFTAYNAVPDGGSTVALLGSALFAVGFLRQRFGVGKLYDSGATRFDRSR